MWHSQKMYDWISRQGLTKAQAYLTFSFLDLLDCNSTTFSSVVHKELYLTPRVKKKSVNRAPKAQDRSYINNSKLSLLHNVRLKTMFFQIYSVTHLFSLACRLQNAHCFSYSVVSLHPQMVHHMSHIQNSNILDSLFIQVCCVGTESHVLQFLSWSSKQYDIGTSYWKTWPGFQCTHVSKTHNLLKLSLWRGKGNVGRSVFLSQKWSSL